MSTVSAAGPDGVEELYRQIATHRADKAHVALRDLVCQPERLFSQSANALEGAAGVLRHAAATYVLPDSRAAREMEAHAAGLVNVASRFEAAADLARQERA